MQRIPRLPGYELFHYLGGGPLTAVYAGRDCATDEACAVKVLRDDWEDQPTAVKLLQREARAGLKVRDPRLVQVLHAHVTRAPYRKPARWNCCLVRPCGGDYSASIALTCPTRSGWFGKRRRQSPPSIVPAFCTGMSSRTM